MSSAELNEELLDAARYGDLDDVKEALSRGADVDFADESGKTALHMAAANGHADVIRLLLNGTTTADNSSQKAQQKTADPSPKTKDAGNTPLHWACLNGHAESVKVLLEGGANPAALNAVDRTPVDEALGGPHQDAILAVMREFAARGAGGSKKEGAAAAEEEDKAAAEAAEAAEAEVEKEGVDADDDEAMEEETK